METYSFMREFADSWMLLVLTLFFVGVVVWAFRPGSAKEHSDTANIPFRHEDQPAGTEDGATCHKEART
ncbi:CcoQ/FixQ family Cbb3-type cytochrome c oxidase assembly chaperone [Rhodovulum sulfidophilum]|uniref:CcoQ/FixQ family Cbb3-type cytochrome c oxidase assembly chaperone n=1 Tax=Rhodovulum sulfidophilum TaxID=35806 RepID=A0A0D6AYC4_RHOSU|nr:CcoQ/FixQ family Cbb3-type cytochrome c oxidase assembly chaperone [Rhodovulum sulfidophilum]ANB33639.1 cytochrome-c oxidase [Rhodovulum sulfidophilum DSM 1374]ANB37460.1 cytochrome-c oxidase [Rhodovulum sulfidophilum]MBL3553014.1 CcoQ/FixQ family Cbb3-type cytochrome c oxidase assembly chaperone [Rhodovulum sulfidophilum]MBL3560701.1 CcoQ/FixQ family Cbb3-type cytochrome c oxidase assembly chaperone [Rhodovulum sulfidophilum]MBL3564682.1 CcoQ/FixQ family Cbb3-type cytochrome c oxidase asse